MKWLTLKKELLKDWLQGIIASGREVIAPTERDGIYKFFPISDPEEIQLRPGPCSFPFKEWLFPSHETLFAYRFDSHQVRLMETQPPLKERVGLFLRPCDAIAVTILDRVFLTDLPDPLYQQRRSHTTLVSLACDQKADGCFCDAVGYSPSSQEGADLFAVEEVDRYLIGVITEKGEELTAVDKSLFEVVPSGRLPDRTSLKQFGRPSPVRPLTDGLLKLFDNPIWQEVARTCLGCGICAYLCPTCHCFDIADEGDAYGGVRCRNWDSCAFALFTLHASGHNPRPDQPSRYRQRVLHKFAYFVQTFERNMCVGCGRCRIFCPAGLDILKIVHQLAERLSQ